MNSNTSLKAFVLGFVIAALLLPAPAHAQWTVFDPVNYSFQVTKKLEEINRWLETVQQYTQMYENAVGQLTNLKAIKLEQMSQIVTTLSRDIARRAELALTMRY